jgi:hypothetical protein
LAALGLLPIVATAGADLSTGSTRLVAASNPRFRYEGRFDFSDPASPVVVWEASRIAVDFSGDRVALRFRGTMGQVFFDATVDGATSLVDLREKEPDRTVALPVSGPGPHHLTLFKRSEATCGLVHFAGIELAPGAGIFAPPAPAYRMRMEVFGDSITVGACVLDGKDDQWDDRRTHDAAYSWAALVASAYSADYRNISVSGMGLVTGFVDVVAGQMWDRTYPRADSPKADLAGWMPDAVFVLLGDNDDSYPRAHHLSFPGNFTEKYVSYVRAIRAARPKASIILLNGAMWAGTQSPALLTAWTAAASKLESGDPGISHFVFVHWTKNHPRVSDHRILADELLAWLKAHPSIMPVGPQGS